MKSSISQCLNIVCTKLAFYGNRGYCRGCYKKLIRSGELKLIKCPPGHSSSDRPCNAPGCNRLRGKKGSKGYCSMHYLRLLRGGSLERKFVSRKNELRNQVIEMYESGNSTYDIASYLGYTHSCILGWLTEWCVRRRPEGFPDTWLKRGKKLRTVDSQGYVKVWEPSHPNARNGYVAEHRIIMEKKIGRNLHSDEVVHHVNNNPSDNSPENLILMTRRDHTKLHKPRCGSGYRLQGKFSWIDVCCKNCDRIFKRRVMSVCRICRGPTSNFSADAGYPSSQLEAAGQ